MEKGRKTERIINSKTMIKQKIIMRNETILQNLNFVFSVTKNYIVFAYLSYR